MANKYTIHGGGRTYGKKAFEAAKESQEMKKCEFCHKPAKKLFKLPNGSNVCPSCYTNKGSRI